MPVNGKGYGPTKAGRSDAGGNSANNTTPKRSPNVGGNTANMGGNKGQQHIYPGGNYQPGQPKR